MNVVTTTILRNNLADVIDNVDKKKYLLVAKRGKIKSALVDIDLFEDLLALGNRKYLESIKKARKEFKRGSVYSHAEVFGSL